MKISNQGQSLVEFCVVLQVFVVTIALSALVGLKTLLPFLLQMDLYDLARAHLYHNDLEECAASALWPQHLLEVNMKCPDIPYRYEAQAFLIWNGTRTLLAEQNYELGKRTP